MKRVVIIGGGIAGLAAAYSLREHQGGGPPFEIVILEKNERLGGNIKTERTGGFLIEGGPDCFLSEKPWAMELCKRVGLADKLLATNEAYRKTYVLSGGKLHVLPEGVILMVPTKIMPLAYSTLISWPGKLRMAAELFIPKKKDDKDETLGSFVRRRLGREVLDKIAEPLVAGVHAGDPETMSVRSSFPKFVQLEQEHGSLIRGMLKKMALMKKSSAGAAKGAGPKKRVTMFMTLRDGLSELIETLSNSLSKSPDDKIRTKVKVRSVEKTGKGYAVSIEGGETLEADSVIVAAPAWVAASVLKSLDPVLEKELLSIPYVSTATISLGYRKSDIKHPMDGFGFVVPKTEGRRIMAASWVSRKFDHRAPEGSVLIRCFVGGSKNSELVSVDEKEMVRMVRQELREIMGIEAEPVLARVFKWNASMPQYTVGHEERIASIEARVARYPSLFITGSAYHGIGISDSVRNGEIVAKKALHAIKD